MSVREGSVSEALAVEAAIPEFGAPHSEERYTQRLTDRRSLILVAELDDRLVGYKVGYQQTPTVFYSWLGGVIPKERGAGIATALRERQEQWARAAGYRHLRVKSKNRFPSMLRLLIGAGYQIIGTEGDGEDLKIVFELTL